MGDECRDTEEDTSEVDVEDFLEFVLCNFEGGLRDGLLVMYGG